MALMKMTILAFKSFDNPMDLLKPRVFLAMFNPASYKVEYNLNKDKKEIPESNQTAEPISLSLRTMSFEFLIDGTGANGDERVVLLETRKFAKVVLPENMKGESIPALKPDESKLKLPNLMLIWGTFAFTCQIENYSVNYTLFNQSGIPLRATISANFIEVVPDTKLDVLDMLEGVDSIETISNVASFLSTAFTVTNNVARAVDMARDEDLNSLRQNVTIK